MKYSLHCVRSDSNSCSASFSQKRVFSNLFEKSLSNFKYFFKIKYYIYIKGYYFNDKLYSKSGGKSGRWSASGSRSNFSY